jgi:hypothetical protein
MPLLRAMAVLSRQFKEAPPAYALQILWCHVLGKNLAKDVEAAKDNRQTSLKLVGFPQSLASWQT